MTTPTVPAQAPATAAQSASELVGRSFVRAYNDRDVEAMVALAHPEVVGNPSRPMGGGTYRGHAGLRNWWQGMVARGSWYDIAVSAVQQVERRSDDRPGRPVPGPGAVPSRGTSALEPSEPDRRQLDAHKLAMFGDICLDGEALGPWAAVLIIQDGLILRQRSYLSTRSLLEEIGIVAEAPSPAISAA
jgi:hypothetical protein